MTDLWADPDFVRDEIEANPDPKPEPIRISIDDKPTRPGFHEMADLGLALGYTAAGAGWTVANRNSLAAQRVGEAVVRNPQSGDSIMVIAATPEAAIERLTLALQLLTKGS